MNKVKKGAEPKGRLRHVINNLPEFYHLGINRDEYCITKHNGGKLTSAFGYFFIGYEAEIKEVRSKDDILDNWETNHMSKYPFASRGFKEGCFAIYNRRKNVLVVDSTLCSTIYYLRHSVNADCKVILVRNITDYNIINKPKELAKSIIIYHIDLITKNLADFYRVIKGYTYHCNSGKIYDKNIVKSIDLIRELSNDYPSIPRNKVLCKSYVYLNYGSRDYEYMDCPTINDIINYKIFNKEEVKLIHQRHFWTKYGFGKGISFKKVKENWNTKTNDIFEGVDIWQYVIIAKEKEAIKNFNQRCDYLRHQVEIERKKALDKLLNETNGKPDVVKYWRENKSKYPSHLTIQYKDFIVKRDRDIFWFNHTEIIRSCLFDNVQLKLSSDKKEVYTSKGAVVTLSHAIYLFNKLYNECIKPKLADCTNSRYNTRISFLNKNITIGYYKLRNIFYKEKESDDLDKKLGYKEWCIEIGCHCLWLDDVKEFCRYYRLEDKVDFDCKEVKH